jgi:hypothetical protein
MSAIADIAPLVSMVETEERVPIVPKTEYASNELIKADTTTSNPEALMAAANEITPEGPKTSVELSISPTSAAVMQSLFYKEMMVKLGEEDNSSTTESTYESVHDEDCSCQEQDTSSEMGEIGFGNPSSANNEEIIKSFDLSDFVETDSKDNTSDKEDELSDEQGDADAEDMPKKDVILNILSQFDPLAVDQVCCKLMTFQ